MTQSSHEIALEQQPTRPIDMEPEAQDEPSTLLLAVVEKSPEQQPTQPIETEAKELDELSTLSIAVVEKLPEQQPTQPIETELQAQDELSTLLLATVEKSPEQQPTQPIETKQETKDEPSTLFLAAVAKPPQRQPRQPKASQHSILMWHWCIPLLVSALLIGGALAGHAALTNWLPAASSHGQRQTPLIIQSHRTYTHSAQVISKKESFMDAMMHKEWANMWLMLSPDAQQLFQGEQDFAQFEQAKFGSLSFVSYKTSAAEVVQPWLDPDTTQVYPIATVMQVSLQATAPPGLLTDPSNAALNKGLFHNTLFAMTLNRGQWEVVVAGPADIDAAILVPASPPKVQLLVPIFMYHHVSNEPTHNALDYSLTVTTTDFDAQLSWLQQQGYHSINLTELFNALYYGKVLPSHPMILTFDDGYEDVYTDALPVLMAHHYRGVFFIITGMIGGNYLTWDQVRILGQSGMQIASHTVHHVNIGQPPYYTSTQKELTLSKAELEARLGQPIQFFCYPSGEPFHHDSYAEQQLVLADLLNDGYVGATLDPFSFDSAIQNVQTPYQLPRIRVSGGESLDAFSGTLNFTLQTGARNLAQSTTTP